MADLPELGIEHGPFPHRLLDGEDVRDLGAAVKMDELEAVGQVGFLEQIGNLENLLGTQAELGILAGGFFPLALAAAHQPDPEADHRRHLQLLGIADDIGDFLDLFHHQDDLLAQLAAQERGLDINGILIAVADDQAFPVVMEGQGRVEFRLGTDLKAVMERLARVDDLLDHLAQLVDLDGINAAVDGFVFQLDNGVVEGLVDPLHPVAQQVMKADEHGKMQTLLHRLLDHVNDGHGAALLLKRRNGHLAAAVDIKIAQSPTGNTIQLPGPVDTPGLYFRCLLHLISSSGNWSR